MIYQSKFIIGREVGRYRELACCCEISKRVLICSETTPTARNATHERPAPMPKRLVKVEAIQSVESAAGLFCLEASEVRCMGDGGFGGDGDCEFEDDDDDEWFPLVAAAAGNERNGCEVKKEAIFTNFN